MSRIITLIGTTDEDHKGDPGKPEISDAETDYMLRAVSEYFRKPVTRENVRWAYSGIRPLYDDGASKAQEATRDYVLKLDHPEGGAPLLSVFGGKITTFRKLAESAMEKIEPFFPRDGQALDAVRSPSRRRLPVCRGRERASLASPRKFPFLDARTCAPPVPRLWHGCGEDAGGRAFGRRHGAELRTAHGSARSSG